MKIRDEHGFTLFDYDIHTGRQVWKRENGDGTDTYRTDYRVDDVLDANHDARMDAMGTKHGDWSRIASIPLGAYYGQGFADAQSQLDGKYIDKLLDENSKFRTR